MANNSNDHGDDAGGHLALTAPNTANPLAASPFPVEAQRPRAGDEDLSGELAVERSAAAMARLGTTNRPFAKPQTVSWLVGTNGREGVLPAVFRSDLSALLFFGVYDC